MLSAILAPPPTAPVRSGYGDANVAIAASDDIAAVTAALTAPRTWTLPAANAVAPGHTLTIVDEVGGVSATNWLKVAAAGSDTVNGLAFVSIERMRASMRFESNGGSQWTTESFHGAASGASQHVTEGTFPQNIVRRHASGATAMPQFRLERSRGAPNAPTVVTQNTICGDVIFAGWDSVQYSVIARLRGTVIAATPGSSDMQSRLLVELCPAASVASNEIARLEHATGLSLFGANPVVDQDRLHRMRIYTVATLPAAGTAGRRAAVSDASAPAFLATVAGGGAVFCPVIDNGTAWVCG